LLLFSLLFVGHAPARDFTMFQRDKVAAWCIVPFDVKKRTPVERAAIHA